MAAPSINDVFATSNVAAIKAGLKKYLAAGGSIEARNQLGWTPLFRAFIYPPLVKLLIDEGADVDALDPLNHTALMAALDRADGGSKRFVQSAKHWLAAKPKLNVRSKRDGETALFRATRMGLLPQMKLLLEAGADCNIPDHSGMQLLVRAIEGHNEASSKKALALLLKGSIQKVQFPPAIAAAKAEGWPKIVKLLEA